MEAEIYPDPRVQELVVGSFIPVRVHVREHPEIFERFRGDWTPTILVLSHEGREVHRIEGFLGVDDLLAQLELGLARVEFEARHYEEASQRFRTAHDRHPQAGAAPEALYWAGVSDYKASHDGASLKAIAKELKEQHPESEWARKAGVWSG